MCIKNTGGQPVRKFKGFTLMELIVTVLIMGVIFAAGIPGLQSLLGNVSLNAGADKLVNSLAYGRGEAVARVENISLGAVGAGQIGWNVFIDTDADCALDAGEEILRVVDVTADNVTIVGVDEDGVAVTCVGFNELGEARDDKAVSLTVDSTAASSNAAVISVSPIGYTTIN